MPTREITAVEERTVVRAMAVFENLLGLVYNVAAEFFGGIVVQID